MEINQFAALLTSLVFGVTSAWCDEPDFNRDIRPILSDKCYFCHGPDADDRQAGLRLDTKEGSNEVISSGYLLERILAEDPDDRMPPPESKLSLSTQEISTLKSWIKSGAKYERHWAFQPLPKTTPIPIVPNDKWSKNEIDRFVFSQLEQLNWQPAKEAEPLRWLRRITLDLTGLPPTVKEIKEFLDAIQKHNLEYAYEAVVVRLLNSKSFGEHMAVAWLDAARYADSYGYQSDRLNTQWPFRDWVVKAFNDNLPYDQFVTWQLAGDLLDNPTPEQQLATAFNRLHRLNNEGGSVFEEWRLENVADRLQTFGTAMLGLTMECCRCHDHKYDPIPMRDYYSMSAFFNSIDENGVYDGSQKVPSPSMLLPNENQKQKLEKAKNQLVHAEAEYAESLRQAKTRFSDWVPEKDISLPDQTRAISFDAPFDKERLKGVYYFGVEGGNNSSALEFVAATNEIPFPKIAKQSDDFKTFDANKDRIQRRTVRFDGERGIVLPGIETFDRWTPFSIVLTLKETNRIELPIVIAQASFGQLSYNGWDLVASDGYLEFRMYRVRPGNMIAVRSQKQIPNDQWFQVTATYDGSSDATGLKIFLNGEQMDTTIVRNHIRKRAAVRGHQSGKFTIGQRFRDRGLAGWLIDDARVFGRAITAGEVEHLALGKPFIPAEDFYVTAIDPSARKSFENLTNARKQFVMAEESIFEIPVMKEMPQPRETHFLARGEYDAPTDDGTKVQRAVFSNIGPEFPKDFPLDRLGLARWATLPDHPLTARVIVNRIWSNFFGRGLVRTPENFGLQGQLPTHPELLDWLARDFVSGGWDIKRLCQKIVMSATYRQDSVASDELKSADPDNKWLARGPSYRLSSEQIRDLALATSGLLNEKMGGPPVSPYQAGGDLWRESNTMSPGYKQSVGTDLYRRSLYSVWKRTAPLPNMLAFDAESREVCIVKRARTNTPLQALVLMNDQQFVEAARAMAEALFKESDQLQTRIESAFQKLAGRHPDQVETKILNELFESEFDYYQSDPEAATNLINSGNSKPDEDMDTIALAAMTVVCQAIMNLDAAIWKR